MGVICFAELSDGVVQSMLMLLVVVRSVETGRSRSFRVADIDVAYFIAVAGPCWSFFAQNRCAYA